VSLVWLVLELAQASAATIGYWRFEEGTAGNPAAGANSVLDSSGNGLNGTPANGPVYSTDLPPWGPALGSTLSLHFRDSTRVFVPDIPVLQLSHSLTIEASVKTEPMLPNTGGAGNILIRGDNRPGLDPFRLSFCNLATCSGSRSRMRVTTRRNFSTLSLSINGCT
jgi:hypothetical protein